MEDKIEVGEYIRTKEGLIGKIKEFIPHYTKGKREGQEVEENFLLMGQEQCKFIESIDYRIPPCYPSDEEWEKIKKYIVKHSKQLIDLIEDKDIVEIELSEEFVEKKDKKKLIQIGDIYTKETLQKDIDNGIITRILTILSYNQYIANCYKVGGEENETSND